MPQSISQVPPHGLARRTGVSPHLWRSVPPRTIQRGKPSAGVLAEARTATGPTSGPQISPGAPGAKRPGSWGLKAPEGAYGAIAAWTSGAAWFDALMDALATPEVENARKRAEIALRTLLMIANADRLSADANTGRGVATASLTVAVQIGKGERTVERGRAFLESIGFEVTVVTGRYLEKAERVEALAQHGCRQIKAASLRALTVPRPRVVETGDLPLRGEVLNTPPVKRLLPTRAPAHEGAAARPAATSRRTNGNQRSDRDPMRHSQALQMLAGRLDTDRRLYSGSRHIGHLCDVLARAGIDPDDWTASDINTAINQVHIDTGRHTLALADRKNPMAYLGWMLRMAIDPTDETPGARRRRQQGARVQAQRIRVLEREEVQRRLDNEDPGEWARIKAESDREIAELNRQRRYARARSQA